MNTQQAEKLASDLMTRIASLGMASYYDIAVEITQRYAAGSTGVINGFHDHARISIYLTDLLAVSTCAMLAEQIMTLCPEVHYGRIDFIYGQTVHIAQFEADKIVERYNNWEVGDNV